MTIDLDDLERQAQSLESHFAGGVKVYSPHLLELVRLARVGQRAEAAQLFMITDRPGWGYDQSLVIADTEAQAVAVAKAHRYDVEGLGAPTGEPRILWSHSEAPDTPREVD